MSTVRTFLLLLLMCIPVYGEEIILDENTPNDVLAVRALIEKFDSGDIVVRTEPFVTYTPAFVAYAESVATFGECAVDPLRDALHIGATIENKQVRTAAAIALAGVGPAAMRAEPEIQALLDSTDDRDNILACGIIQGIGPDASTLVGSLRTLLYHDSFHVQYWSCRAIASIGPGAGKAAPDLCILLESGVASVRRNAAVALGEIADGIEPHVREITIDLLIKATEDYSKPVRVAAAEALGKFYEGANE